MPALSSVENFDFLSASAKYLPTCGAAAGTCNSQKAPHGDRKGRMRGPDGGAGGGWLGLIC